MLVPHRSPGGNGGLSERGGYLKRGRIDAVCEEQQLLVERCTELTQLIAVLKLEMRHHAHVCELSDGIAQFFDLNDISEGR